MYTVIDRFHPTIMAAISPQDDVAEYEWLLQNVGLATTEPYQQRYKNFWAMNAARLSGTFYAAYFDSMTAAAAQRPKLSALCQTLYESSRRRNGIQTLQFSFATKLLHMLNPQFPIYDSRVARFFFFKEPTSDLPMLQRIDKMIAFHNFLITEYAKVIKSGQLASAIAAFRQRFNPQQHTDEKIIDWLIWALVGLAEKGAFLNGQIAYV